MERSFSDMKQIKTRLRNRLGEDTLDQAMRISIEGPEKISSDSLDNYSTALERTKKPQTKYLILFSTIIIQLSFSLTIKVFGGKIEDLGGMKP